MPCQIEARQQNGNPFVFRWINLRFFWGSDRIRRELADHGQRWWFSAT